MAQKDKALIEGIGLANLLAIVALIVLAGLGGHYLGKYSERSEVAKEVAAVQAVSYDGVEGENALDLLREKAQIETQDSSIGTFVLSINGTGNSEDHYWMFYVNGELSPVGADQYQTQTTDEIEWRYEQIQ